MIWLDFETKSDLDLTVVGAYNYAMDASTDVLCMAYAYDDGEVQLWTPGQPLPPITGQIRAHNAAFERLIFLYVLQQAIPLERFYCTAVQARANGMPGSLEDVGRAASSKMRKDHRGKELVRKCCCPPFNTELLPELFDYCMQDVRAMREVSKSLRDLTAEELHDYHVNERINDRGVRVDMDLCHAAIRYSEAETAEIQALVADITGGEVTSVRSPRMREWVLQRVGPVGVDLMRREDKYSIDKTARANLLQLAEENPDEVPAEVADVIQCADDIWASSVAKFKRLTELADFEDSRVRGAFVFNGGAATGRASSYGAQVHNFTRKCAKDPELTRAAMVASAELVPVHGRRVTDVLKGMLRPALIPAPEHVFVVADWSAIEGRVNPWLSPYGEAKLQLFRDGLDPYIVNAAAMFSRRYDAILAGYDAEDPEAVAERQVGKVQELALGFAGGEGAFAAMAKIYGVRLSSSEVNKAIQVWRANNPWAVRYWSELENAYMKAMRNPGREFRAGRVTYLYDTEHLWYALPSGRVLRYPYARLESDGVSYLKSAWKPAADATEWPRARLWKGLACENITQATANDLLRNALRQIPGVVLHGHDEIVTEVRDGDAAMQRIKHVMRTPPAWAAGLPLEVGIKIMRRYGK